MAVTALIFVFLLLVAPRLYAQQSATLQGHVLDTSGGTVAGATITLRSRSVDFDASVHTDSEGRYVIHANFGPPGNIVGSPTFGKITRTRFSTGEAGSSRQIQLALKAWF